MKPLQEIFHVLLFACLFYACKKSETPLTPIKKPEPEPVIVYKQYGQPFKDVPNTKDVVMYEINLRAFSPGGNLQGVIDRLDKIKELGVNVIWLMPIHPIGMVKSVNSPYAVRDYKAVSEEYGTMTDLRKLVDGAHERGMAVILDWVGNHTSWDNVWIGNKSWYTTDASGNIVSPNDVWKDLADLNFNNESMRKAMIDAMKYWVYEANIDGFRCDYADGVPYDFWKRAFDTLQNVPNRKFVLFAEGTRTDHFTAGFHLNFAWKFFGGVKDAYKGASASKIFEGDRQEYSNITAGKHWLRFTTNHDDSAWDSTPIKMFNGIDGALAASVVTMFMGGVPLIYAGQEVGTVENVPFFTKSFTDWNSNPNMREAYTKLIHLYRNFPSSRYGTRKDFPQDDVICFQKMHEGKSLLVITNIRNKTLDFTLPDELKNSTWANALTNADTSLKDSAITLLPYQYLILKKD